jgi:hypothetical protein
MKKLQNIDGLTDLNVHEQRAINGGESLWYYIGYALGKGYTLLAEA